MTAIDAYQRNYRVVIAAEAVAAYDEEHHQITLRYLRQEMAQVLTHVELFEVARAPRVDSETKECQ
jgi:isochorismate hydrolase